MTWTVIAFIMRTYHGVDRAPSTWRHYCRPIGAAARPRGYAYGGGGLREYINGHNDGPGGIS